MDAFSSTRVILAMGQDLPGVIEAVAAFRSAKKCKDELKPGDAPPADPTAAQALLMLAAPLLTPRAQEGEDFGPLRDAAALAREPRYRRERQAYYDWMREFVKPLQSTERQALHEVHVDQGTMKLAAEQLQRLVVAERELLGKKERRRWWTRAEYAMTVISVGAAMRPDHSVMYGIDRVRRPALVSRIGGWSGLLSWQSVTVAEWRRVAHMAGWDRRCRLRGWMPVGVAGRGGWLQTCVVGPDQGRAVSAGRPDEAVIRTPDRRVRVFVSSTLGELAEERRAVARAISALRLTPVMFELGARPYPPREVYQQYLAQSDVFIGLYWQRYGQPAPGAHVSGLEEEFELSGGLPRRQGAGAGPRVRAGRSAGPHRG